MKMQNFEEPLLLKKKKTKTMKFNNDKILNLTIVPK